MAHPLAWESGMTPTQQRVLAKLKAEHPHAITKAMCEPISPRSFEHAVRDLRLAGYPIASDGSGYYWTMNPAELRATADALLRRMGHVAETMRALEATARDMELAGLGASAPSIWDGVPV